LLLATEFLWVVPGRPIVCELIWRRTGACRRDHRDGRSRSLAAISMKPS
jgi:hypothetical protein